MSTPVIAIDGPSASGKGTIASRVAKKLGFHYLESGALYRIVGLLSLREDTLEEKRLVQLAEDMDLAFEEGDILLGDEPITDKVRSELVGNRASVHAHPSPGGLCSGRAKVRAAPLPGAADQSRRDSVGLLCPFNRSAPAVRRHRLHKKITDSGRWFQDACGLFEDIHCRASERDQDSLFSIL
jgi:hypothetical protein